ncbi:MAG TPA: Xaa-Pro peptidase family protein, partial [Afifellaceae bacterium]|nr:Xaa-Pro peptidase family protein [Afifellaceae bacterium]
MSEDRYEPLRPVIATAGVDAVALVPGSNFRRLFGRDFHVNERSLVVVVPKFGAPAAVVPSLEAASFELVGFEGAVHLWRDHDGPGDAFAALGRDMSCKRIGVEGQYMRVMDQFGLQSAFAGATFVDLQKTISNTLRLRKTSEEIARLQRAIAISEDALTATLDEVRAGQSEIEIESILLRNLFSCGAEGLAFEPIVAAADNSYRPHAKARRDYRVKPGDALLFDFGAVFDGYRADITRTVFVGHCPDGARAFYETVRDANRAGRETARPGITAHELDDAVQSVLEASPYAAFIRTKTGHGLGLDVHEDPYIMRGNHEMLEPGMVLTVEPGLYD